MNYENMTKEELIQIIKVLEAVRINYEKKFGIIMYANGDTERIEAK